MRWRLASLIGIVAVLGAEGFAFWWMKPGFEPPAGRLLELRAPAGGSWKPNFEAYDQVDEVLNCSSGWIGDVESGGRWLRFSFFRWDWPATKNTLEAFEHMPEVCMGSSGWKLERVCQPRELIIGGRPLPFDVTFFRGPDGLASTYVYKAVWMKGFEDATLRDGFSGADGQGFRRLRLERALHRSGMPATRVVMGAIPGVPTEEMAWREFRRLIGPQLQWETPPGSST